MWSNVQFADSSQLERTKRGSCCFSRPHLRIVKNNDGYSAKQEIGAVCSFCEDFEDWLDLKCNLHEMVKVHVSRVLFIHTHFALTCGASSFIFRIASKKLL